MAGPDFELRTTSRRYTREGMPYFPHVVLLASSNYLHDAMGDPPDLQAGLPKWQENAENSTHQSPHASTHFISQNSEVRVGLT